MKQIHRMPAHAKASIIDDLLAALIEGQLELEGKCSRRITEKSMRHTLADVWWLSSNSYSTPRLTAKATISSYHHYPAVQQPYDWPGSWIRLLLDLNFGQARWLLSAVRVFSYINPTNGRRLYAHLDNHTPSAVTRS
ncbi:hypothetical protein V8C34DRAFT_316389 [Trichoderma compactum]